ncbi:MAG TPA: lipid A export permease/ATP-binding protein MsbA, partial [Oxalicibacterium sp.]|nr:lipid A export permease/ATP-binding protein MsbA [Oxalicibacterium sp.]
MKIPLHLKRLFGMLGPYRNRLLVALLGMIMTAATEPMFPAVMRVLLDKGFAAKPSFSLWLVPVAIIGIFVLRGISTFTTTYTMTWITSRLLSTLRQKMFNRMLDLPMGFYAAHSVGRVINSMMFEVQQVIDMITRILVPLIRDTLTVFGLLAFLLWLNWRLTLVALVLLPLIATVVRMTGQRVRRLTREYQRVNGELTQVIEETTRANQVIKIFGGQQYEHDRFEKRADKLRSYSMRMVSSLAATTPITQIMASCAVAVVIVIALIQSGHNQTTVGGFVSFITAMLMLLAPLKSIAEVNGPLQKGLTAAEAVFGLIDEVPERTTGKTLAARAEGRLEFANLSFSYPGHQQRALRNINLDIRPGETLAFVGMSGGGKSTLVNLVPGFYPVTEGEIRLDGESIEQIALTSLRQQIAMVSQHVVLFDDTVAANIAYGDATPDRQRVTAAAKAAHLEDVINGLPEGLDTMVGDNGSRLSGGQRQRLAIARAIYKNAPILILDEATSALDSESERAVQAAL